MRQAGSGGVEGRDIQHQPDRGHRRTKAFPIGRGLPTPAVDHHRYRKVNGIVVMVRCHGFRLYRFILVVGIVGIVDSVVVLLTVVLMRLGREEVPVEVRCLVVFGRSFGLWSAMGMGEAQPLQEDQRNQK